MLEDTFGRSSVRCTRLIHILIGRNVYGHLNFNLATTFTEMTSKPVVYAHITGTEEILDI